MDFLGYLHLLRHSVKEERRTAKDYNKQSLNRFGKSTLYNWWKSGSYLWFVKRYGKLLEEAGQSISFCSVFGKRAVLEKVDGLKVFFSGENVHNSPYDEYSDYLLKDKTTSLGLGFECFENERYRRFPLWILYMFNPESTREDVIARCNELRYPKISKKNRFCSMVASHDWNGLRKVMVTELNGLSPVSCAGRYLHNDDSLKKDYGDDKIAYLKAFCFNICPENSNSYGYVTEKVFEAIDAGCIPVYWGSYNHPEPGILNEDAILFWHMNQDNEALMDRISHLYSSPGEMDEFLHQPRLMDGAEDYVWEMIEGLDSTIWRLVKG